MKTFKAVFLFIFSMGILVAAQLINNFKAYEQSGKVVLEWNTATEEGISHYVVQRSMNRGHDYYDLSKVSAYGAGAAYLYIDENILGSKSDMTYTYRLKAVYRDGSVSYSNPVDISMNISSVEMTWGSIKAMFR